MSACASCGHDNAPDAQFCAECGEYLGWSSGAPTGPGRPHRLGSTTRHRPTDADAAPAPRTDPRTTSGPGTAHHPAPTPPRRLPPAPTPPAPTPPAPTPLHHPARSGRRRHRGPRPSRRRPACRSRPAAARCASAGPAEAARRPARSRRQPPTDLARVARALDEGRQLAERHNRPDLGNHLEQARKRLGEQVLSVAVVGEFKRGKSTLVNALLQTDVCPTDADIVTAVPTVVRYGPEPSAVGPSSSRWSDPAARQPRGRHRRRAGRRRPARRPRLRGRRRELAAASALGRGPPPPPAAQDRAEPRRHPRCRRAGVGARDRHPRRAARHHRRGLRDRRLAGADGARRSPSSARPWSAARRRSAW